MILKDGKVQCDTCANQRPVPGDCHSSCANPDPDMTVDRHGYNYGWAYYPFNFDPIWLTKECCNYTKKESTK